MADAHAHDHDHDGHDHAGHDHEGHEDSTTGSTDSGDTTSWLFSFGASDVKGKATRNGHMTFSFDVDDCSMVTAFTDRPQRLKRQMKMKRFAKDFDKMFGKDKPNASLTHWDEEGGFHNHVYEIEEITKKKGRYILKTDLDESTYLNTVIGEEPRCKAIGCVQPPVIDQANFFLDDGNTPFSWVVPTDSSSY